MYKNKYKNNSIWKLIKIIYSLNTELSIQCNFYKFWLFWADQVEQYLIYYFLNWINWTKLNLKQYWTFIGIDCKTFEELE